MFDEVEGGVAEGDAGGAKDVDTAVWVMSTRDEGGSNWPSSLLFDLFQGCVHLTAAS